MRSGWLILLLLAAAGTNTVVLPSACGSHGMAPNGAHAQLLTVIPAPGSIELASTECSQTGHSSPQGNLSSVLCNFCQAQASVTALSADPSWPLTEATAELAPRSTEIYLAINTKPPTFHS